MILSNLLEELEGTPCLRVSDMERLVAAARVVDRLRRLRRYLGITNDALSRIDAEMSEIKIVLRGAQMDLQSLSEAIRVAAETALAQEFVGLFAQYGYVVSCDSCGGITAERAGEARDVVHLHLDTVDLQALLAKTVGEAVTDTMAKKATGQSQSAEGVCPSYVESRDREDIEDALGSLGSALADEVG